MHQQVTDWKLNTEILTYSRSRGAFVGITLNGAVIQVDNDSTLAIYGRGRTFQSILSGKVRAPKSTLGFMKAIAEADHAAMIAEANPNKK
jgi:lipid-binding SYLF domain-containing protein